MINIVFDVGAVLLAWAPVAMVQTHFSQLAPTAQAAQELSQRMFHHEDWLGFDRGVHGFDDAIGRMALRLSLPRDGLEAALSPVGEWLEPIDVSIRLLESLRLRRDAGEALRLFYLSNMSVAYARYLEEAHAFFQCFDGGIFSGDVKLLKPQPEIYDLLALRCDLKPEETIFIDDSLPNVQAENALGWRTIHCQAPTELPVQLAQCMTDVSRINLGRSA